MLFSYKDRQMDIFSAKPDQGMQALAFWHSGVEPHEHEWETCLLIVL